MELRTQTPLPVIPVAAISPFVSLTIVEITQEDFHLGFRRLVDELKSRALKAKKGQRCFVAEGIEPAFFEADDARWMGSDIYDADAFVVRCERSPQWLRNGTAYVDTEYKIVVLFRRENLVVIQTDLDALRNSVQSWLDKSPPPPYRRIPDGLLNAAFLGGDTKGIWLRGTHVRRSTKADAKNLSGSRLQDALLPHADSSFAMGSARAALPNDLGLAALTGVVGTTPRKSHIWVNQAASGMLDFFAKANDALVLIQDTSASGLSIERPFPLLAHAEKDINQVAGAFDFSVLGPDDIAARDADPERIDAASVLTDATIYLDSRPGTSRFSLRVGLRGSIGGSLAGRIYQKTSDSIGFKFGLDTDPTDLPSVRTILDALNSYGDELLTIYYESGHTVVGGKAWKREIRSHPFPNWDFRDLSGVRLDLEKPSVKGDQAIHDAIGEEGDSSLFGWISRAYSTGWLVCDDGPGEVADFVHIGDDPNATLSLIHVKAATTIGTSRQIAVGPYEIVASQASKNLQYLHYSLLAERLAAAKLARPASWAHGRRTADRSEFLEMLACRRSTDATKVIIVQPHVSAVSHEAVQRYRESGITSHNILRMKLLDDLLNTTRAAAVSYGADLFVIGSKL